jgi:hypothetical protein
MIDRLVTFLLEPQNLLAIFLGLLALGYAVTRPELFVYLAAGFTVLVSITPPTLNNPEDYIALWGPLESVRAYNRYFAIAGGSALLVAMASGGLRFAGGLSRCASILLLVHGLILAKNLVFTSDRPYVIVIFIGFAIVTLMLSNLFGSARTVEELLSIYLKFVIAVACLFFVLNLFQYRVNSSAMFVIGGRFHGITFNPQMFVISAAPCLPVAYLMLTGTSNSLVRLIAIGAAVLTLYWCYLTGSRLALLLVIVGAATYFQFRLEEMLLVSLVGLVLLAIGSSLDVNVDISSDSRMFSTTDTRTRVWKDQINLFFDHPIFGAPVEGDRLTFGESTWLGAAAGLGIAGLAPMLMLLSRTLGLAVRFWKTQGTLGNAKANAMILAVVMVSVAGSFFEAFLFGVLTLPMSLFLATVIMLERLFQLPTRADLARNAAILRQSAIASAGGTAPRQPGPVTERPTRRPQQVRSPANVRAMGELRLGKPG